MRLNEMSTEQRETLRVFNDEMRGAGWEMQDLSAMLAANLSVEPEAMASHTGAVANLEAHLLLSQSELRLFILRRETDQLVRLVLRFNHNLQSILHCLIGEQDGLNTTTFPQLLLQLSRVTEQIWFVDHEGDRFLLDFPHSVES